MKIAVITDDEKTVSQHFGRAAYYAILTIEDGKIIDRQMVSRANHSHHHHNQDDPHDAVHQHNHDHHAMIDPIADCQAILVRGMGRGAHSALTARGIQPIITDICNIEQAVQAYLSGTIVDYPEKLH